MFNRLPIPALFSIVLGWLAVPLANATDYHVAPTGKDTNDGLRPRTAFRSLMATCRAIPAGKHVIRVAAGEFEEAESCVLPPGVSLIGAGIGKTVFRWKAVRSLDVNPMKFDFSGFLIQMKSSAGATISGLTVIGGLPNDQRAHGGIFAHEVRNVSIHDCEVKDLEFTGIWLSQAVSSSVHHCQFEDCGHPSKRSCSGALQVGDLTDCTLHHNRIREHRGAYGIKTWKITWTKLDDWGGLAQNKAKLTRVRLHDNDVKVRQQGGWGNGQPNMALELWNSDPTDCEIDRNRFNECVSLVEGAGSPKTIRVHHNLFILEPGYSYAIEAGHHNLEIDHNVFRNGVYPIASFGHSVSNLRIHHNTFDGIEDIGVCNLPGVSDFSFTHNTVILKKAMNVLNIGKEVKPGLASSLTVRNNLFVKEGAPPCATPILNLRGGSKAITDTVILRKNAFWNWSPEGPDPMVADPLLERAADGGRLLRFSAKSPVRTAGKGNIEDDAEMPKF